PNEKLKKRPRCHPDPALAGEGSACIRRPAKRESSAAVRSNQTIVFLRATLIQGFPVVLAAGAAAAASGCAHGGGGGTSSPAESIIEVSASTGFTSTGAGGERMFRTLALESNFSINWRVTASPSRSAPLLAFCALSLAVSRARKISSPFVLRTTKVTPSVIGLLNWKRPV